MIIQRTERVIFANRPLPFYIFFSFVLVFLPRLSNSLVQSSFTIVTKLPCPQRIHWHNKPLKSQGSFPDVSSQYEIPLKPDLTHADLEWRLCPPEGTSLIDKWKLKLGALLLRFMFQLRGLELPPVLCPRGGRALLEAHYKESGKRRKKIARFGITTSRGPSCEEIDSTIRELYKINPPPLSATIAAILYMYVEPEYRHRNVGSLAIEVIAAILSVQAVDFIVLVADDDGSGGLVRWYEGLGFSRAPKLQTVLGSPDQAFGVAMICPVTVKKGFFRTCTVKWW